MSGARVVGAVITLVVVAVIAHIAVSVFSILLSSTAALNPGDMLYTQQQGIVETVANALPVLIPSVGIIVAALAILARFSR